MKKKFFPVIAALLVFTALPAMAQSDQSNLNTRPVADAPAAVNADADSLNIEIVGANYDPDSKDVVLIGRQNYLYPTLMRCLQRMTVTIWPLLRE
jgi:hypothetical protein